MTTTITDIDTQVYGPNVHVWGDDFPDDKNYQRFVDEFECEKIQTISTQLYNVFYECHMNVILIYSDCVVSVSIVFIVGHPNLFVA